jgi:uncharacterized protein
MQIAVFSDSHDHLDNLEKACAAVVARGITTGIHLGDFCAPFMIKPLIESDLTWYGVFGNNDGDRLGAFMQTLTATTDGKRQIDLVNADFRELEIDGLRLFLTHYPQIARISALSGQYDVAFHGHDHKAASTVVTAANGNTCPIYNPGELCGARFGTATYGIFDTQTREFTIITL